MWFTLIVGVIGLLAGAFATGIVQLFLNYQADQQQIERDRVAHARQVAAARRDRLIARYEGALLAGQKYFELTRQARFVTRDGPPSSERAQMGVEARAAFDELEVAIVLLSLERGNADVIELCNQLQRDYAMYMSNVKAVGDYSRENYGETFTKLKQAMQAHVYELENSV